MKVYRIYTEDKDEFQTNRISRLLVKQYFPAGLTVQRGIGFWDGNEPENSLIFVVATDSRLSVLGAVHFIMGYLEQKAVGLEVDGVMRIIHADDYY